MTAGAGLCLLLLEGIKDKGLKENKKVFQEKGQQLLKENSQTKTKEINGNKVNSL